MSKNVLVAGINGFVGKHLAKELQMSGFKVYGTGTDTSIDKELKGVVTAYYECDLTDPDSIKNLPLEKFNSIVNLAGLAQPSTSFGKEDIYNKVNVEVHTVLLEAIKVRNLPIRVIVVSTGAVYDNEQDMPLTEKSSLLKKGSPYAMSKILMESAVKKYMGSNLDIIVVRPFNHTGPGQLSGFIVPDLVQKIMHQESLTVGPENTSRDYTDVRDVVRAYRLLLQYDGELPQKVFNVCSEKYTSRDELIENIKSITGKQSLPVRVDQALTRPNDAPIIFGSHHLLTEAVGWQPEISLDKTLKDYINWVESTQK